MRRHWTTRITAIATGALMLATVVPVAVPQAVADSAPFAVQQARLTAPAAMQNNDDTFGSAVDVSGDTVVVGAPHWDSGALADAGGVWVYTRSGTTWSLQQQLTAPATAAGDLFGTSVAIDGNRIVVGAPHYYTAKGNTGAAFVYTRTGTTWSAPDMLPTELISDGDLVGQAVAIDGDTIVLGCPGVDVGRGELRPIVWNGSDWDSGGGMMQVDPTGATGDRLGTCVALKGDSLLASAGGDDRGTVAVIADAGSVVAFQRTGSAWAFDSKFGDPAGEVANEQFGGPIDIADSEAIAIVGSMFHDGPAGTDSGAAYIFYNGMTGWELSDTINNPGPNSPDGDNFGSAVALGENDFALIGAFWDDSHTGAAYYYQWREGDWMMSQKITPTADPYGAALFGDAAAIDSGTAVVGATLAGAGTPGELPGAAFVFSSRATITGICRHAITGTPLAGVEVMAHYPDGGGDPTPASDNIITGADGRYTISIDSGEYYLNHLGPTAMYRPGWYNGASGWPDADPLTVWAGNTYTVNFTIYPKLGTIFRFYNFKNNTHFFTDSVPEAQHVVATWPDVFAYEGFAYITDPATDTSPLFRFYNIVSKSHFYTADSGERDDVIRRLGYIYQYDGPTYGVSRVPVAGKTPVYRFYNLRNGSHFYTADLAERDRVIGTLGYIYQYEGPAFWIGEP